MKRRSKVEEEGQDPGTSARKSINTIWAKCKNTHTHTHTHKKHTHTHTQNTHSATGVPTKAQN